MHGNQIIAGYFINERQILLHIYTPVRRFPVGNDRFVGRGELWGGGGCRQERPGVSVWGFEWAITESDPCSTPHKQRTLTGLRASSAEIFI